jgi:hypothetical protein
MILSSFGKYTFYYILYNFFFLCKVKHSSGYIASGYLFSVAKNIIANKYLLLLYPVLAEEAISKLIKIINMRKGK